jgi:membrane associated rhomboid family serine protease
MLALFIYGRALEIYVGRARFVFLYAASGLAGAAMHVAFTARPEVMMVGASGAITGLIAAFTVLLPDTKPVALRLRARVLGALGIAFWIGLHLVLGFAGLPLIAWFGHAGGALVGIAIAIVLRRTLPKPGDEATSFLDAGREVGGDREPR